MINIFSVFKKQEQPAVSGDDIGNVPAHVAIIMDGNRRWAEKRNLPKVAGYRYALEALRDIYNACIETGVKYLTIYAFSTENKFRPKDEVQYLEWLFIEAINTETETLRRKNVKIRFVGRLNEIKKEEMHAKIAEIENATASNTGLNLQVMYNYGGRAEIADAVKKIVASNASAEDIDEDTISKNLYMPNIPDPDLLIRTGGDMRISNFLLWEVAYSEIIVVDTFFPDFRKKEFMDSIKEYSNRSRRFGR